MNLHEDSSTFEYLINGTAEFLKISDEIIEKDYFVTLLLKSLVSKEPRIIFKGGTSLSKCYNLINRFSEDIDLNYDNGDNHLTEGQRKKFSVNVRECAQLLQFELENEKEIRSRRNFNRYDFMYQTKCNSGTLKKRVIVETAVSTRSFPIDRLMAGSYIFQYLQHINKHDIILRYELTPFEVAVQTKERTFIDKVFAICDYFIQDKVAEHSRHLYDLHMLYPHIIFNPAFKELIQEVRIIRAKENICPSAQPDANIGILLTEILAQNVYQKDYNTITKPLLFEDCIYETVKETLDKILHLGIF